MYLPLEINRLITKSFSCCFLSLYLFFFIRYKKGQHCFCTIPPESCEEQVGQQGWVSAVIGRHRLLSCPVDNNQAVRLVICHQLCAAYLWLMESVTSHWSAVANLCRLGHY